MHFFSTPTNQHQVLHFIAGLATITALPSFHSAMTTPSNNRQWCLCLIECRDGSFYAGITNDLDARYKAHVEGRGARYTRAHPPIRLIGAKAYENRSAASRAEWEIKQLPKQKKIAYLQL